ncbi:MAG: ABC transporter ATPase [Bacteroidetes bacterium]|nr:ABC transporter ATPase [Bacteroidota bacterium]
MLDNLAPHSRVWVYQSTRFFTPDEEAQIRAAMKTFIPSWASHGNVLYGDFLIVDSLFLIVGVDEQKSLASGCSIDTLNREIKRLGTALNIEFFDRLRVAFIDKGGKLNVLPMHEFKALMKKDEVTGSTTVFNNLIETKTDLETKWKTSVKNSWHKNLLEIL